MFGKAAMLYLYVETPLHAGSGTSLGIVDLPIQRERTTGYPIVQASGLKGCLREAAGNDVQKIKIVFGPDTQASSDHAGAVSVGDARILLFPVRSLMGVFAWVTSKDVLARFKRDAQMTSVSVNWTETGPTAEDTALVASNTLVSNNRVVLEEFAFTAQQDNNAQTIANWIKDNALPSGGEYGYWRQTLPQRLVILPENAFRDFTQFSTEVISRIRLDDEKKTVARGALWSEEHLPSDTLLYALLFASKPRVKDDELPDDWKQASDRVAKVMKFVKDCVDGKRLQLGGDSTVGRGFVKVRMGGVQP
jgi:CRISPR-associated protein Cmr4